MRQLHSLSLGLDPEDYVNFEQCVTRCLGREGCKIRRALERVMRVEEKGGERSWV